ncbi:ArsR/SmtB family transcription factor [Mangrovihabitans endophyticus]|uniref:ArsR family transcriptional regulator n=1 Tax=Mangrovihabitans endophyticus TaxID=1751298 RepID=A0A8J3BWD5_9ACTN|nr:metalloregulator ArsR/SmtB family transcription factor [Mangrovihabitans endophyticus]GGK73922.1 ArsR family transcriptional regulator [Mangrovihabitans endophyticus]
MQDRPEAHRFPESEVYRQIARIGKAVASPIRLRLLDLLEKGESDVEGLAASAGVPLKNTSAQLQQLRAANLVTNRREGTRILYRLAGPEVSALVHTLESVAELRLADLRTAIGDLLGEDDLQPITAEELSPRLGDPDIMVVDVRSAADFARGHLPGAVSVPAAELESRLDAMPAGREIIAYCQGPYCVLSPRMVRLLHAHDVAARPLSGGITRWQRQGHPVEP